MDGHERIITEQGATSILVLDDWNNVSGHALETAALRERGACTIVEGHLSSSKLTEALTSVEVLFLWRERTRLTRQLIESADQLKVVVQTGYTWSHIDVEALADNDVVLVANPDVGFLRRSHPTSEFVIGLLFALAHRISEANQLMVSERWPSLTTGLLADKTLGILGFGKVGQDLAVRAAELGMSVMIYSRSVEPGAQIGPHIRASSLNELLLESDFVSVHLPLTPDTRGFVGDREFSLMKKGAYFLNTARGPIVDEPALVRHLESGKLSGAALDVFADEPLPRGSPFRAMDNVIVTPHIGWTSDRLQAKLWSDAVHAFVSFLDGSAKYIVVH